MLCADVRNELVAYLDGELDGPTMEKIASHLAECEGCRRERETLGSTGDLLLSLKGGDAGGPDLAARVLVAAHTVDPWCTHIRRELVSSLDGELTETENRPVMEHLDECEDCAREAKTLARTGDALASWRVPAGTSDILDHVLGALGRKPRGRLRRLLPLAAAAALLLLAGLATVLVLRSAGDGYPTADTDTPPSEVLLAMDLLDTETLDLLDEDPELIELADQIDWLESVSEEELALLGGPEGG